MSLMDFIKGNDLDKSLMLGYYGGGNYGDELLMEVLAGLLKKQNVKDMTIAYQHPEHYHMYHHDFGFDRVNMHDKLALFKAIIRSKKIVVGGGGLWGVDFNFNVLLMSIMLFVSRWVFRKKIYLLSIGYYDSAPTMGRFGAWLAGKAANHIVARDQETFENFSRINKRTEQDIDIAWYVDQLDLAPYQNDLGQLEKVLTVADKTLFITLRRFGGANRHHLAAVVAEFLRTNDQRSIIVGLLEPRQVDPYSYGLLESWQKIYPHIQIIDFSFNPLALFLFFQKYKDKLLFFGPQFHAILSAHLTGVPYMPLVYDNKVANLLQVVAPGQKTLPIQALKTEDLQQFAHGGAA